MFSHPTFHNHWSCWTEWAHCKHISYWLTSVGSKLSGSINKSLSLHSQIPNSWLFKYPLPLRLLLSQILKVTPQEKWATLIFIFCQECTQFPILDTVSPWNSGTFIAPMWFLTRYHLKKGINLNYYFEPLRIAFPSFGTKNDHFKIDAFLQAQICQIISPHLNDWLLLVLLLLAFMYWCWIAEYTEYMSTLGK